MREGGWSRENGKREKTWQSQIEIEYYSEFDAL